MSSARTDERLAGPDPTLPLSRVTKVLSSRWSITVMEQLAVGSRRFNELNRRLDGINHKVLMETLLRLQRDGYVRGPLTVARQPVPRPGSWSVTYELTALGYQLMDLVETIRTWTERHEPHIITASAEFVRRRESQRL